MLSEIQICQNFQFYILLTILDNSQQAWSHTKTSFYFVLNKTPLCLSSFNRLTSNLHGYVPFHVIPAMKPNVCHGLGLWMVMGF